MNSFEDLKITWNQSRPALLPPAEQIKEKASAYQKTQVVKIIISILTLMGTSAVLAYVFMNYQAKYVATYWGIAFAAAAVVGAIAWQSFSLTFFTKPLDPQSDNKTFLAHWQGYQNRMVWGQRVGISIYFLLLSIGLALYLFEFAQRNWSYGLVFYAVTGAWIAVNWFYFRPRIIAKQTKGIMELIDEAQRISSQLSNQN